MLRIRDSRLIGKSFAGAFRADGNCHEDNHENQDDKKEVGHWTDRLTDVGRIVKTYRSPMLSM